MRVSDLIKNYCSIELHLGSSIPNSSTLTSLGRYHVLPKMKWLFDVRILLQKTGTGDLT